MIRLKSFSIPRALSNGDISKPGNIESSGTNRNKYPSSSKISKLISVPRSTSFHHRLFLPITFILFYAKLIGN